MTRRHTQDGPTCDQLISGAIELYFYGELSQAERDAIDAHLPVCRVCRDALEELGVIRRALAARPIVSAPPSDDWSRFMGRLGDAVAREGTVVQGARRTSGAQRVLRAPSYAGYVSMAALLALVTMSVLFTARSRHLPAPPSSAATVDATPPGPATGDPTPNAAFVALTGEHLERSKLVVLGLATKDPQHTSRADWMYERELASTLLSDTRVYRMAAEDRGMRAVAGVMRDLELVLLQASLTDDRDPAALAQIQRLIRKRDLLEKMNMATTGL